MHIVQHRNIPLLCDSLDQRKSSVQYAAIVGTDDQPILCTALADGLQPKAVGTRHTGLTQFWKKRMDVLPHAKNKSILRRKLKRMPLCFRPVAKSMHQLVRRISHHSLISDGSHQSRQRRCF